MYKCPATNFIVFVFYFRPYFVNGFSTGRELNFGNIYPTRANVGENALFQFVFLPWPRNVNKIGQRCYQMSCDFSMDTELMHTIYSL